MKKKLILTLALIVGISSNIRAAMSVSAETRNLDSLENVIKESQKRTELVELCIDMNKNYNLTIDCSNWGRSELREILIQAIENERKRIIQEREEQIKQEEILQIKFFITRLNNDVVYEDFENICNAVKKTYPNCEMPSECDDSSIKEISSKTYSCLSLEIGSSLNCKDYLEGQYVKENGILGIEKQGVGKKYNGRIDISQINKVTNSSTGFVVGESSRFFTTIYLFNDGITKEYISSYIDQWEYYDEFIQGISYRDENLKKVLTKSWLTNCIYEIVNEKSKE